MATAPGHRVEPSSGMGPRKTMIIMVTVVGCVAILWPKVFYPMMVGNGQSKNVIKDHRGAGCCGVVLDQETFANASINFGSQQPNQQRKQQDQQPNLFRKWSHVPFVEIHSIRQERPPHLRPEAMHPAMRERGRAIPQAGSIHGGDRPQTPPRIVEGRPGPIPGMRPPMGAGSHQATKSANSMGFIMPLYTIGIVSFFIYTIMKLIFKKSPATPYAEVKPDPAFRNEVFTTEPYIKRPDDGTTKLGLITAADEQLLKIDNIKKQTVNNLSKESNVTADEAEPAPEETATESTTTGDEPAKVTNGHAIQPADAAGSEQAEKRTSDGESSSSAGGTPEKRAKKRDTSMERGTVKVMAMEMTAQRENGKRLSRPTTPLLPMGHPEGASATVEEKETRSIMLDGRLPHDSKILVAESETAVEKMEPENSEEEDDAPVILSGKMTLSLINMDFIEKDATGTVAVGGNRQEIIPLRVLRSLTCHVCFRNCHGATQAAGRNYDSTCKERRLSSPRNEPISGRELRRLNVSFEKRQTCMHSASCILAR
uniref:Resistance to inhibitors of cholinesterase protein 3 N-terminal domain-containing protein n=1 Tax=Anopheles atroparvus TaxID=41427 RepID=A0AAG5D9Q5_ANOAO